MKKRKKISLILWILAIIATLAIFITVQILNINEIIYCDEKYNNLNDINSTEIIYEPAVNVCWSDNKRYWSASEACKAWVKYIWSRCPTILQKIIDKHKN